MKRNTAPLAVTIGFVALFALPAAAWAQVAPALGAAQPFGVLGNSGVTGATGSGVTVNGAVGSSPTATISNFPPSSTVPPFAIHTTNDSVVQQAHLDAIAAYNTLQAEGTGTVLPDNLATVGALTSGIYSFTTGTPDLPASATLTLNGGGVFIFNVGSSLTMNVLSNVVGTADPCNVYWRIGSSATLNGTSFSGTVLANTSITVGAGANVSGRALAGIGASGAVTMAGSGGNTIGGCASPLSCPTITLGVSPAAGQVGVAYSQTITASGGTTPFTFTMPSGTLPPGLTLTSGGALSGTPTAVGTFIFQIRATDASGCSGVITYQIVIAAPACPTIALAPSTLPNATLGVAYSQQLTASGGTGSKTFTVSSGTLPAGLKLSSSGLLSGTPTTLGSSTVTVTATDGNGCPGAIMYSMGVAAAVPTLPQAFVILLAAGLAALGYVRLRKRALTR